MIAAVLIVLSGLMALAISFACSFTCVTLYIMWNRRGKTKYAYSKPAEPYIVKRDNPLEASTAKGIDGTNAVQKWKLSDDSSEK